MATEDGSFNGTLRRMSAGGPGLLGGPRALLMQIAHPKVAQGVEDHSEFRASPFPRLVNTMHLLFAILYGDEVEADEAVQRMHRRHNAVKGNVGGPDGEYSAHDPELKCWVWATLVDSTEILHEEFVGPIAAQEQVLLYSDWVALGRKLGIPRSVMPEDHAAFRAYMERMTLTLVVSDVARAQAEFILDDSNVTATLPWVLQKVASRQVTHQSKMAKKVTAATLPPRLREAYGLPVQDPEKYEALRAGVARALGRVSHPELLPRSYMMARRVSRPFRRGIQQIRSYL